MTIIESIVEQISTIDAIPSPISEACQTLIADSFICGLAGRKLDTTTAMHRYLDARPTASAQDQALALGFFAHALDFDNSSNYIGHNSAVLVPAALAISTDRQISGADFVRAYAIGTEVSFKIAMQAVPDLNFRGFHITPVFGVIGATVEAALLLGLDDQQLANALSLAVSQASGLMGQFGSSAKYLHCGLAASNALRACELALAGVTGRLDVLESDNGFYRAYAGREQVVAPTLGGDRVEDWAMGQFSFLVKMYPCCSATHAAVEALRDLQAEHDFTADQVAAIRVEVPEYSIHNLQYSHPVSESQARFSMGFALAHLLVNGRLDLTSFTDEWLTDPRIIAIEEKVQLDASGAFPAFVEHEPAIVHVQLDDGRELVQHREYPRGRTLETPATPDELRNKAHGALDAQLGVQQVDALVDKLNQLDQIADISALSADTSH